ncbi:MAG: helix-turn-helix domain-containing protein [Bacteroidales bacterium]|nr:helix-turn-helix domain-containing protein [Candidatus Cacconaster merdequi]
MAASKITIKKVCEWCGQEFYAKKLTTRFCCKRCNEHAYKAKLRRSQVSLVEKELLEEENAKVQEHFDGKQFLTVIETAALLGLTRMTVYNMIYSGKLPASRLSSRLTLIRRSDIDLMMSGNPYSKISKPKDEPITEFYTTNEIKEKFGVSNSWIFKVGKEKNIPKIFKMGNTYWSKSHIDKAVAALQPDESITEWYSVPDMQQKFNMSLSAIYNFAHDYSIPKKKVKREVYYSKKHIDIAKGIAEPEKPQYYSMKEAMEKFDMTRDQLFHYIKRYNVPKYMEGKYVRIAKKELDAVLAPPELFR